MKTLAIIGLVVLVSAGSSAAVTTRLVTSKDIKNGTIRLEDLSAAARKGMRGPRGPEGREGPQGPPGVTGTTIAGDDTVYLDPGQQGMSVAQCPNGKVTGGGWTSFLGNVQILRMAAYQGSWRVTMVNPGGGGQGQFTAEALCLSP
jgi:hypothetical protein